MRFVGDSNVEPDRPRSTMSAAKNSEQKWKVPSKRRGSSDEDMNAKCNQMCDTTIQSMQQPAPTIVLLLLNQPPLTDEDIFGQYVASQPQLLDAKPISLE